jgi:hypothetical protein
MQNLSSIAIDNEFLKKQLDQILVATDPAFLINKLDFDVADYKKLLLRAVNNKTIDVRWLIGEIQKPQ